MIGNMRETMRHIPEDELHSYLDQALSRSQCVEIESHLAACESCRRARDNIAALRDRTTALLATLAPPRRFSPSIDVVRERASERATHRHRRRRAMAWAASVVAALGLGWWANTYVSHAQPATTAVAPDRRPAPADRAPVPRDAIPVAHGHAGTADDGAVEMRADHPAKALGSAAPTQPIRLVAMPRVAEPPRLELSTASLPTSSSEPALGGIWRTLSWAGAQTERGDSVPHIDGLPVVEVQVGQAGAAAGSKSIMVVAQQLASGEVIRTIEGPAADVSQLLNSRPGAQNPSPWPTAADPGIAGGDGAMAMRHGDRMLAITAQLSNDSLRAMMRRLNAEMRGR